MSEQEAPKHIEEYFDIWKNSAFQISDIDADSKFETISHGLLELAQLNKQFITIYNVKKQKMLFMSDNYAEILGYNCTPEQYKKWSVFYWMRDLQFSQSYFILQISNFYKKVCVPLLTKTDDSKSLTWYLHNFKLKPPGSVTRNMGITTSALEIGKNGKLEILLIIIADIGAYIKNKDTWWFDIIIDKKDYYSYNSLEKKMVAKSIISDREKEILQMIANGQDTKTIAEKLDLSPLTVEKHRKNMLDRTGAKDISMLLQICKIGKLM
jgi:DNA-binding CsgD family transcriptional regulator